VCFCLLWCNLARPSTCGEDVTCQNSECSFYLLKKGRDVVKKGFNSAGHQVYMCRHCSGNFVETINTPMYYKHLDEDEVMLIGKLANEKVGIRACERITGHHRDTVSRIVKDLASFAESREDSEASGLKPDVEHEVDELWAFFKKRRKT
jgi:transposase-like protein